MKFFKRKTAMVSSETLTSQIGQYLTSSQRRIANYLNGKTRKLSGTTLLFGLIIFCGLSASYLLFLIIRSFR